MLKIFILGMAQNSGRSETGTGRNNAPTTEDRDRRAKQIPNSMSEKRLLHELTEITRDPPPLCTARLEDGDLYKWVATINGPPNSVYEDGVFNLSLKFRKDYPFQPPIVSSFRILAVNV